MLTVLIVAALIIGGVSAGIFLLARKASNSSGPAAPAARKGDLTQEQSQSLQDARARLTNIRMTLARVEDRDIARAGNEACASIEKVLQTLKEKPEKMTASRQLFNYYLPTLEKVVTRYQRIEAGKVTDEELPRKLKDYLVNVKDAMDNLYEGLYDSDKLHVDVDMEAMTIAIRRDGLLDDEDFAAFRAESSTVPDIKETLKEQAVKAQEERAELARKVAEAEIAAANTVRDAIFEPQTAAAAKVTRAEEKMAEAAQAESAAAAKAAVKKAVQAEKPAAEKVRSAVLRPAVSSEEEDYLMEDLPEEEFLEEEYLETKDPETEEAPETAEEAAAAPAAAADKIVLTLYPDEKP